MTQQHYLGIIGGSGLYSLDLFKDVREVIIKTPYGDPSAPLRVGRVGSREIVFLARHGDGHIHNPSEVNYRANIWALKKFGVTRILSVSAVGSLREEIVPGHFVAVDQFIDRTKKRAGTFFENGIVAHVSFAHPVSSTLHAMIQEACRVNDVVCHKSGTYVCMEGPQFSTVAESRFHQSIGGDVIGMTNMPEAKLAREAEIDYATLALSTDYDCWHPHHDSVTSEQIIAVLTANIKNAQRVVATMAEMVDPDLPCDCAGALKNAIFTKRELISDVVKERLRPILAPYI